MSHPEPPTICFRDYDQPPGLAGLQPRALGEQSKSVNVLQSPTSDAFPVPHDLNTSEAQSVEPASQSVYKRRLSILHQLGGGPNWSGWHAEQEKYGVDGH